MCSCRIDRIGNSNWLCVHPNTGESERGGDEVEGMREMTRGEVERGAGMMMGIGDCYNLIRHPQRLRILIVWNVRASTHGVDSQISPVTHD